MTATQMTARINRCRSARRNCCSRRCLRRRRANGFAPDIAANGNDVLRGARTERYELLILDIGLPGSDRALNRDPRSQTDTAAAAACAGYAGRRRRGGLHRDVKLRAAARWQRQPVPQRDGKRASQRACREPRKAPPSAADRLRGRPGRIRCAGGKAASAGRPQLAHRTATVGDVDPGQDRKL